eukprot:TRINITY_DN5489_c0_g1_i1.p2 TRINITY_DN5489_c0_g1~~TRINITY_DN5489_c0_g1_i1.p2  ORF type:complete len:243 (-),score=108.79 TRINITY_DN5489_c0_g1_i1:30-758(-)
MADIVESAKRKASFAAVDEFVTQDVKYIGIGSGSTVVYAVERLNQLAQEKGWKSSIICVPTSFQATQLIVEAGLQLGDLSRYPQLDLAIDGADEVDSELNCIKGGGGCQTQEKIVASCAKTFIVVADYRKDSKVLGEKWKKGVPIEVIPLAHVPVMHKLSKLGGSPKLRMAVNKAGPVVTDNGNFVVDCDFKLIHNPIELEKSLSSIPGIVESGLFIHMAVKAFFGNEDGSVSTRSRKVSSL